MIEVSLRNETGKISTLEHHTSSNRCKGKLLTVASETSGGMAVRRHSFERNKQAMKELLLKNYNLTENPLLRFPVFYILMKATVQLTSIKLLTLTI
jgi:hypothetical protein